MIDFDLLDNVLKSDVEKDLADRESHGLLSTTESRMRHMQRREESRKKQEIFEKEHENSRKVLNNILNNKGIRSSRKRKNNIDIDSEIHLDCGHCFHSFCIRGWVMIGKRHVCPVCQEKVDMSGIFANPWHKQDRMWSQLLDAIRYLLVWNPIICMIASLSFNLTGMKMEEHVTHEYTVYEIDRSTPNDIINNNMDHINAING